MPALTSQKVNLRQTCEKLGLPANFNGVEDLALAIAGKLVEANERIDAQQRRIDQLEKDMLAAQPTKALLKEFTDRICEGFGVKR